MLCVLADLCGMSSSSASWEDPHWGVAVEAPPFDLDCLEIDYEDISESEAAVELFEYIVRLKRMNILSATQACILAFWASKAGATGMVTKLAYKPNSPSGHFSRHFNAVVDRPTDKDFYRMEVPLHSKLDASRNMEMLSVVPPHEAFAEEVLSHPD